MKERKLNWKNYGDVNVFEGGCLIAHDKDRCYYCIRIDYDYDREKYQFANMYVDLDDDWINWNEVADFCGKSNDDYWKVFYITWHYAKENFTCSNMPPELLTEKEVKQRLKDLKVKF